MIVFEQLRCRLWLYMVAVWLCLFLIPQPPILRPGRRGRRLGLTRMAEKRKSLATNAILFVLLFARSDWFARKVNQ